MPRLAQPRHTSWPLTSFSCCSAKETSLRRLWSAQRIPRCRTPTLPPSKQLWRSPRSSSWATLRGPPPRVRQRAPTAARQGRAARQRRSRRIRPEGHPRKRSAATRAQRHRQTHPRCRASKAPSGSQTNHPHSLRCRRCARCGASARTSAARRSLWRCNCRS